jgi:pyruvate dehydrogenase E1 component
MADDVSGLGVLVVTSADRLLEDWRAAQARRAAREPGAMSTLERLLGRLAPDAPLVTVIDGHPGTLAWLGSASGRRVYPLGVDRFGQSGDILDLYRVYGIDAEAIVERAALACTERLRGRISA